MTRNSGMNKALNTLSATDYRTPKSPTVTQSSQPLRFVAALVLGVSLVGADASGGDDVASVRYTVSFEHATNHYVDIRAKLDAASVRQEVFLPVWTPGSYLVREYARHIDTVEAVDARGKPLEIKKTSKNRWQLSNPAAQSVTIMYRVYCNELTVRTNFVDREFALLNGAALFLTSETSLPCEHTVELKLPTRWHQSVTSLERRVDLGVNTFIANSYDELVDSPIVVGNPTLHPFNVEGVDHYLVNVGGDGLWDGEQAAADVAKIVKVHQDMWGQVPYEHYHFLNVIAESGGGLEHDNSTVMLASRWSFRDKKRYKSWLGLVSHEFFHTWNVRRLRPRALTSYKYETENYFEELWVAEGVTSYYDDLALARAGHTDTKEYLAGLSKQINTLQSTDGRLKQSLAESSYDAWIKHYRPNENSRNTTISYYNKGSIVAFLLDIEIRNATENEKSLDDVMRALYEDFALKDGYTTQDVMAEVNKQTGADLTEWFQRAIYSTEELDYGPACAWLGLRFKHETAQEPKVTSEPSTASPPVSAAPKKVSTWTGLGTKSSGGRLIVSSVAENSPAFDAGINVDDEIIAVNDYRVSESIKSPIDQFAEDGSVGVLLSRRGKLSNVVLVLEQRAEKTWVLQPVDKPTEDQEQHLASWLHKPIEEADKATDSSTTD